MNQKLFIKQSIISQHLNGRSHPEIFDNLSNCFQDPMHNLRVKIIN
jgi:hypothetical protein